MQTKYRPFSSSLLVRLCTAWMVSIALMLLASVAIAAHAPSTALDKLSSDLRSAITASKVDGIAWARDTAGGRMVKIGRAHV